jgi:hypothetical protein
VVEAFLRPVTAGQKTTTSIYAVILIAGSGLPSSSLPSGASCAKPSPAEVFCFLQHAFVLLAFFLFSAMAGGMKKNCRSTEH